MWTLAALVVAGDSGVCPTGSIRGSHGVPACCPASCKECGGKGCANRPGGADNCCALNIQRPCESNGAPCLLRAHQKGAVAHTTVGRASTSNLGRPQLPSAKQPPPVSKGATAHTTIGRASTSTLGRPQLPSAKQPPPVSQVAAGPPRWPTDILLGLTKAGTSELFSCLASDVFASGPSGPCCSRHKELRVFDRGSVSAVVEALSKLPGWPRQGDSDGAPLLDFTPNYLVGAADTVPVIEQAYREQLQLQASSKPLHLIVSIRDAATRLRSHFCMTSKNLKQLGPLLVTPGTCALFPDLCPPDVKVFGHTDDGHEAPAAATSGRKPALNALGVATARLAARYPGVVVDGELSVPGLVAQLEYLYPVPAGRRVPKRGQYGSLLSHVALNELRQVVWPWLGDICPAEYGTMGWEFREMNLTATARYHVYRDLMDKNNESGCALRPEAAPTMGIGELEAYVRRCKKTASGFLHYAEHSLPLFQLAWFLRVFPTARWTFVRHEDVTSPRLSHYARIKWLAGLMGWPTPTRAHVASSRGCNYSKPSLSYTGRHIGAHWQRDEEELRGLFAPWERQMHALVTELGGGWKSP